jgi:hypothetical protein
MFQFIHTADIHSGQSAARAGAIRGGAGRRDPDGDSARPGESGGLGAAARGGFRRDCRGSVRWRLEGSQHGFVLRTADEPSARGVDPGRVDQRQPRRGEPHDQGVAVARERRTAFATRGRKRRRRRGCANLGVAVHGRSFARPAEYGNLARDYPPRASGMFNIGLYCIRPWPAPRDTSRTRRAAWMNCVRSSTTTGRWATSINERSNATIRPSCSAGICRAATSARRAPRAVIWSVSTPRRRGPRVSAAGCVPLGRLCQVAADDAERPEDVLDRFQETGEADGNAWRHAAGGARRR